MLKLTIVGRVREGLPLAQGPRYVNEENDKISTYKQQGEFLLKEISRGALPPSKMTIFLDHNSFNNFGMFHMNTPGTADAIVGNITRKYVDTRTQANLSKIKSDGSQEMDIVSESFSQIVKRRRRSEMLTRMSEAHLHASPIWCSKRLEIIALKWIPVGLVLAVTTVLVWTSLHRDDSLSTGF